MSNKEHQMVDSSELAEIKDHLSKLHEPRKQLSMGSGSIFMGENIISDHNIQ
jgi:hypothetical protein